MMPNQSSRFYDFVRDRWPLLALILLVIGFPLLSQSYFITRLGVILSLYAINVTGMTLLTRYAGIVSLGHSAFFAIGAYMSAVLTVHFNVNPWLAMAAGAVATVVIAYLFSVPFLRLRHTYLAMATLAMGMIVAYSIQDWHEVTGGMSGIPGIPYLSIGPIVFDQDWELLYLAGFLLIAFAFIAENIGRTRLGRAYHAIRTNEDAALASGVDVQSQLRNLFCFTALVSSLAGSLLTHFITFISPELFTLDFSFTLLIIVIVGGANIWGSLASGIVLLGFSEVFRGFQDLSKGLYALLLIVSFFAFPDGISAALFPVQRAARKMAARHIGPDRPAPRQSPVKNSPDKQDAPGETPGGTIMEMKAVSMRFGGTQALSDVSFAVESGHIVGIIGPNGAGKTTLLNVINGYLTPMGGRIVYGDTDVTRKPPFEMARMRAGRTFQLVNLFKGMTVIENVMVGCHLAGTAGILKSGLHFKQARQEERHIWQRAAAQLDALGLMERAFDLVDNLSFGEQRLVELARAMVMAPRLLFLDEPAAGLNTAEAQRLGRLLQSIRDQGITIMLVEHNMSLVMAISDKVAVLDFGKLIAHGTPDHVCSDEGVIKAYLGQEAQRVT